MEQPVVRIVLAIASMSALVYGFVLASDMEVEGIAVAAALAVGILLLLIALTGQVPSSVKVGDVELKIDQARADGVRDGAKLAATAASGSSAAEIQMAAGQALGSIRDPSSLTRAMQAVQVCADVVRDASAAEPATLTADKQKEYLAEVAKA